MTTDERRKYNRAYRQSEKGKTVRKANKEHYLQTERGKQLKNESRNRYRKQPNDITSRLKATLKMKFNMTIDDYNALLIKQNNVCAICMQVCQSGRRLCVDHCHVTGKVRGLLCHKCNVGIGLLNDDKNLLSNAIKYLA